MTQDEDLSAKIKNAFLDMGMGHVLGFYNSSNNHPNLRSIIVNKYEHLVTSYLNDTYKEKNYYNLAIECAYKDGNIDLYSRENWKKMIDTWYDNFVKNSGEILAHDTMAKVFTLKPDADWSIIFSDYLRRYHKSSYFPVCARIAMSKIIETDLTSFNNIVNDNVFSSANQPSYQVRSEIYLAYIKSGLLTKKIARKMRSEASSDASLVAVKALLDNAEKYSNFEELILQFCDSKHSDVIAALANRLPRYLLVSVVATEFSWIKKIIDRRMQENE